MPPRKLGGKSHDESARLVSTARIERGCISVAVLDDVKHDELFKMGKLHD